MKRKLKTTAILTVGGITIARFLAAQRRKFEVAGKSVLITGGSRGLGLEIARQLINEGAKQIAICARDHVELEHAKAELENRGAQVLALQCDVRDKSQIEKTVARVQQKFGVIDVLINNAGVIQIAPVETMTQEWDEAMSTHFWAPLHFIHAVLPQMKSRGGGRIVNIASIGGKISAPHMVPYCSSKFALVGLSHGLRAELAKDGIVVTTVCPPMVRTGGFYRSIFKGQHKKEFAIGNLVNANPLFSISSEKAAQNIVRALKKGEAETLLSVPSQVLAAIVGLFPGLTSDVLIFSNRILPRADGDGSIGTQRATGEESKSAVSESPLTKLNQEAYLKNNEANHNGTFPAEAAR
jgi:NAD(P)-dependent dehydrogenase (short-subunit alcohol dehydrogenase family)